ncbi:MAG: hypothetical protein QM519_10005, partial [Bacteroidia bacterium]|nr:hypothetical protein [Bacteroidia bacterium]
SRKRRDTGGQHKAGGDRQAPADGPVTGSLWHWSGHRGHTGGLGEVEAFAQTFPRRWNNSSGLVIG